MRTPLSCALGLAAGLLLGAGPQFAWAGDYHRDAGLACSDCHVIHASAAHDLSGGATVLPAGGPYGKLLKSVATALCLSCHDGQTGGGDIAPDVMQNAGPGQAAARAAGAFQELPGRLTQTGHSLSVSAAPPGGAATMTLECTSCHDPHGNAFYRNLVPSPGAVPGLAVTAVSQALTTPTATHYAVSNVRYSGSDGGLSAWCGGCHGAFHGTGGEADVGGSTRGDTNQGGVSPWLRHPTRDGTMGRAVTNQHVDPSSWFSSLASRLPVVSPSGVIPGLGAGSDNEVFCGTCHKAHGSSHRYGLIWDNPGTGEPEDGTSQQQSCQQCHNK